MGPLSLMYSAFIMTTTRDILWYGRGGQGAFSAAKLLGAAFALSGEGRHALAFPSFGPERRGAPVRAYTKLSDAPVNDRSAVTHPHHVVCLDETLLKDLAGAMMVEGGSLIVVTDAVRAVSQRVLGRPIVNTTLVCLLAMQLGDIDEAAIELGIRETMPAAIQEKNLELVRTVFADPYELRLSAVHIVHAPKPKPHELNPMSSQFEYMNLMTADGFTKPHKVYRPGATSGGDAR